MFTLKNHRQITPPITVDAILQREEHADAEIALLQTCRKAINTPVHPKSHTNGILSFMTCDGRFLCIREIRNRESPTFVILILLSLLAFGEEFVSFFRRMSAFGFDIVCSLYERSVSIIIDNLITKAQSFFLLSMIASWFVDKMHISTHTSDHCSLNSDRCLFHPHLRKFNRILRNPSVNEQVVEQRWAKLNRMRQIKQLGRIHYNFVLFLISEYHNQLRRDRLSTRKDYWDEPIENFSEIRKYTIHDGIPPEIEVLVAHLQTGSEGDEQRKLVKRGLVAALLRKGQTPLPRSERISYSGRIQKEYKNVFATENSAKWILHPLDKFVNGLQDHLLESDESGFSQLLQNAERYVSRQLDGTLNEKKRILETHSKYLTEFTTRFMACRSVLSQ